MLKNPFYYGEFEYPIKSGQWYKGCHKPLVSREIFDRVQERLVVPVKSKWGGKQFDFKGVFKCACCGASVIGEEKYRKRKWDKPRHHIYYHCIKKIDYNCPEPYLTQEDLIKAILRYINFIEMAHPQTLKISEKLKRSMQEYRNVRDEILLQLDVDPDDKKLTFTEYAKYIMINGKEFEKQEAIAALNRELYIHERAIVSSPLIN